ncbi:Rid family hydrolase [Paraburkholderia antibiotica]|uniref:RidA family protein n=1 Tax=Paraburkholderia antibiotica TaxID=2728839 RepID=A0A7X9X6C3_9BURK|nr:Rid family hydrolase [Paraburkholderia antibiotica]NML32312.1 RidA family protein [Paraburkholderia antibiotica]
MRSFIPFGTLWRLSITVPYSFLVRDRDFAWTCGQVPLDKEANVVAPNDLAAQTDAVCDYIEDILRRAGMRPESLGKLVLYFVRRTPDDEEQMIARCRVRFGEHPVLVPVAVPHFYFDGLLLEVDAFASADITSTMVLSADGAKISIADGGELAWAAITVEPGQLAAARDLLASALSRFGLSTDQRLAERWIVPAERSGDPSTIRHAAALHRAGLLTDEGAVVESSDPAADLVGELTFARTPVTGERRRVDGVEVISRRAGRFAWLSARVSDGERGLISQTSRTMSALADALGAQGMTFANVVKSTSHYVGGHSAEELYENMVIRNACYRTPGPASTGLPVRGFADRGCLIAVDLVAIHAD